MREFKGKVAVITGGAKGIGKGLALNAAKREMKVVIVDVDEKTLLETENELRNYSAEVLAVVSDVSKENNVKDLANKVLEKFGGIHLLFNNAGIGIEEGFTSWEFSIEKWEQMLNVNLWSAIYGMHVFIPVMQNQKGSCHIVNTSSIDGFVSPPGLGMYNVAKHGVVTLSETLYQELAQRKSNVSVSVLGPAWVKTDIHPDIKAAEDQALRFNGIMFSVEEMAEITFKAIEEEKLYVIPDPQSREWIRERMDNIINEENPVVMNPELMKL